MVLNASKIPVKKFRLIKAFPPPFILFSGMTPYFNAHELPIVIACRAIDRLLEDRANEAGLFSDLGYSSLPDSDATAGTVKFIGVSPPKAAVYLFELTLETKPVPAGFCALTKIHCLNTPDIS